MRSIGWAAVLLAAGCYTKRHIIIPPTEHGQLCLKDTLLSRDICYLQKRGWVHCEEMFDLERLNCPGAYELSASDVVASDAGTEPTPTLPGYRP